MGAVAAALAAAAGAAVGAAVGAVTGAAAGVAGTAGLAALAVPVGPGGAGAGAAPGAAPGAAAGAVAAFGEVLLREIEGCHKFRQLVTSKNYIFQVSSVYSYRLQDWQHAGFCRQTKAAREQTFIVTAIMFFQQCFSRNGQMATVTIKIGNSEEKSQPRNEGVAVDVEGAERPADSACFLKRVSKLPLKRLSGSSATGRERSKVAP